MTGCSDLPGPDQLLGGPPGLVARDREAEADVARLPPTLPGARAIAELTPITRPAASTSGPPELPGLIAASVWIALMNASVALLAAGRDRPVQRADDPGGHRALQARAAPRSRSPGRRPRRRRSRPAAARSGRRCRP